VLTPQFVLPLADELTVDNFAGWGGASTGIEQAIGRPVDIAINHDPLAVAMHRVNHPQTQHLCESVWEVDPREVTQGRPVGLGWFSPDCKHFSKAKGGKPVEKRIRGLAWVMVRWAATVKPRVLFLENVEEFVTWGPIGSDGRPCPEQRGREFRAFVNALQRLGYAVEWRELRAPIGRSQHPYVTSLLPPSAMPARRVPPTRRAARYGGSRKAMHMPSALPPADRCINRCRDWISSWRHP
jgi:hypothetical protein